MSITKENKNNLINELNLSKKILIKKYNFEVQKEIKKYERSIKLLPRKDEIAPPLMITINKVKLSNMPAIKSRS